MAPTIAATTTAPPTDAPTMIPTLELLLEGATGEEVVFWSGGAAGDIVGVPGPAWEGLSVGLSVAFGLLVDPGFMVGLVGL